MKRLLLIAMCLISTMSKADSANCPTSVGYNKNLKQFTFLYRNGIPKNGNGQAAYDRLQIQNSVGQGKQWYSHGGVKVKILYKTDTTIVTNNASDSLDETSEMYTSGKHKDIITYWNGNKDLRHDYSSSNPLYLNHCYYDGPLPVKLISFGFNKDGSYFYWATASEVNNDKFILQRSSDCRSWENYGEVKSKSVNGYSSTNLYYDYKLSSYDVSGCYYWRLAQYDYDGTTDYSSIIVLNTGKNRSFVISNNNFLFNEYTLLFNNAGQILFEGVGEYKFEYNSVYFISQNGTWSKVFIKQ